MTAPRISEYGDHAILIQWPTTEFSQTINDKVHALAAHLRGLNMFREIVPGYDSVVAMFDSAELDMASAKRRVEDALNRQPSKTADLKSRLVEIPVHYGGTDGPDMKTICASSGLNQSGVIKRHSENTYRVCMMGFIPGFTFLSPAPKALHHPRLATPRAKVPAGSIGIANWQTGIYGLDSPGGWQIIGRTPLSIFDKTRNNPFILEAGDRVRFIPQ